MEGVYIINGLDLHERIIKNASDKWCKIDISRWGLFSLGSPVPHDNPIYYQISYIYLYFFLPSMLSIKVTTCDVLLIKLGQKLKNKTMNVTLRIWFYTSKDYL